MKYLLTWSVNGAHRTAGNNRHVGGTGLFPVDLTEQVQEITLLVYTGLFGNTKAVFGETAVFLLRFHPRFHRGLVPSIELLPESC